MPRQVISVINGMAGNLRTQLLSGMERTRGQGDKDTLLLGSLCFAGAGELPSSWARGTSVLLQTGELSVKHPENSQVASFSDK